jgi:hypothetical protein
MTVRKYTYLFFTPKLPNVSGGSRQEQLAAQVDFAWTTSALPCAKVAQRWEDLVEKTRDRFKP